MTDEELLTYRVNLDARAKYFEDMIDGLDAAASDVESIDDRSDALAEAIFLRAFTAYERDVELLFLHYVTGGRSIGGDSANTYLRITDELIARKVIKAGFKFLSWAKPENIRETARNYIDGGWPLIDMLATRAQDISDCERIRNRIAHNSLESIQQYSVVQRNLLATERLFQITPGQLLRVRHSRHRKINISHFVGVMHELLSAITDPPK